MKTHPNGRKVACWRAFEVVRCLIPSLQAPWAARDRCALRTATPLVEVDHLSIRFPVGRAGFWGKQVKYVNALDDVSFSIAKGETLGLVGESGSGKTTVGRAVLRRLTPTEGTIRFRGDDITETTGEPLRKLRRHMQLVFQDPYASLNPRKTILQLVGEPLIVHGMAKNNEEARATVRDLLDRCGLPADSIDRYAHAFSGGQRQRVGIARALALRPDFIVADEPVSALDVSVRAQVVNLLQDLQAELGLTYLFIAHDLSVVRHISHRIAILYAGKLVEIAPRRTRCTSRPGTRTPRRCCRACRSRTRRCKGPADESCCTARSPTQSTLPLAAGSRPAARSSRTAAESRARRSRRKFPAIGPRASSVDANRGELRSILESAAGERSATLTNRSVIADGNCSP